MDCSGLLEEIQEVTGPSVEACSPRELSIHDAHLAFKGVTRPRWWWLLFNQSCPVTDGQQTGLSKTFGSSIRSSTVSCSLLGRLCMLISLTSSLPSSPAVYDETSAKFLVGVVYESVTNLWKTVMPWT